MSKLEARYRAFKRDELPGLTCPAINRVRAVLERLPPGDERSDALDDLEEVRVANESLRASAKATWRVALNEDPPGRSACKPTSPVCYARAHDPTDCTCR